jgi:hypothetical protein
MQNLESPDSSDGLHSTSSLSAYKSTVNISCNPWHQCNLDEQKCFAASAYEKANEIFFRYPYKGIVESKILSCVLTKWYHVEVIFGIGYGRGDLRIREVLVVFFQIYKIVRKDVVSLYHGEIPRD